MSELKPKVGYLDTCLVIGIAKEDLRPTEQAALSELLCMWDEGRLDLVTSHVTREEIRHLPEDVRVDNDALLRRLETVPVLEVHPQLVRTNRGNVSRRVGPLPDGYLTNLKSLLRDEDDARHLFQAVKSDVDYFVTDDARTIVSRAREIESHYTIKVRLPSALVAELGS